MIFEKYDGMRAIWHPRRKKFYSRAGKIFEMPDWVVKDMPDFAADGEFWYAYLLACLSFG